MKRKLLAVILMGGLLLSATGCGKQESTESGKDNKKTEQKESVATIDDNASYFVILNGTKYSVGDKISDMSNVGLKQDERELDQEINKNTYLIGGGYLKNSEGKGVLSVTAYNDTDSKITVKDAKIGAVKMGTYDYDKLSDAEKSVNAEFVGGIKLGSSLEDIVKVFGETTDVYESESLGYKKYTYKSKEVYRKFEFSIDKNGKLSEIYFQNLVYNK